MSASIGSFIYHNGKEWCVVAKGDWGIRCQRGYGESLSVIVIQWGDLLK